MQSYYNLNEAVMCDFVEEDKPRTLPASSASSWRHRWGFLRWGWCRGSWGRCCRACGPLRGPSETKPPSGPQGSCRADRWRRLLSCNPEAGAKKQEGKRVTAAGVTVGVWSHKDTKHFHSPLLMCLNRWEHPAGRCLQGWPASQTARKPQTSESPSLQNEFIWNSYQIYNSQDVLNWYKLKDNW